MSASEMSPKTYRDELLARVPHDHELHQYSKYGPDCGRLLYLGSCKVDSVYIEGMRKIAEHDHAHAVNSVCIIEDITLSGISTLGAAWKIEHDFFIQHASNSKKQPPSFSLWNTIKSAAEYGSESGSDHERRSFHNIEGSVPHVEPYTTSGTNPFLTHRQRDHNDSYGTQTNSRVSYIRLFSSLYIFLVDAPVFMEEPHDERMKPSKLSLWVPCTPNRGGLPIPQLYAQNCFSAADSLHAFFSHSWHWDLMVAPRLGEFALDPVVFLYSWAASTWRTNLTRIDTDIRRVAFKEIKRPSLEVNNRLIDRRYDIHTLRAEIRLTMDYMLPRVEQFYVAVAAEAQRPWMVTPGQNFETFLQESEKLENFLINTFDMLMSSVSIQQTLRSTLLTQLAAIYLPVSLVTGIFGMNVAGIGGAPAWSCVVALAIIFALTAGVVFAMRALPSLDPGLKTFRRGRVSTRLQRLWYDPNMGFTNGRA